MSKSDNTNFEKITNALCEYHGRCPNCYWNLDEKDHSLCGTCKGYYAECDCVSLTPEEIIEGWQ